MEQGIMIFNGIVHVSPGRITTPSGRYTLAGSKVMLSGEEGTRTIPFADVQFRVPVFFTERVTSYEWQGWTSVGVVFPVNFES